ncbi:MAG: TetR/AcrR family transcriptional regulator [Microbacteriaceae bacterium]|nr:TetR/AcrR family transcriptional regulator [Microbacteriaceae bacterium]
MTGAPPGRGGRRGPYAKSARTRRSILESALAVFAAGGYRSGSLREIAQGVGLSEAGLLHHFPNKAALLAAVLEHRDEQSRERFLAGSGHPRELLDALVAIAEHNATVPAVVELYVTLSAEATTAGHPAHEHFRDRYRTLFASIRADLAALQHAGELRADLDPAIAARGLIALMDGLQLQYLYGGGAVDMAADVRAYLQSLTI